MIPWASPLIASAALVAGGSSAELDRLTVRVGVIAYEDWTVKKDAYLALFARLSALAGGDPTLPEIDFRMATGTYQEVFHWFSSGFLDAAITTPGVYSSILDLESRGDGFRSTYVATVGKVPATSPPEMPDPRFFYQSRCVVLKSEKINDFAQIQQEVEKGRRLRFLFVDPLSTSGHILPRHVLGKLGIDVKTFEWTDSHSNSLRELVKTTSDSQLNVAFVWDGARLAPGVSDLRHVLHEVVVPALDNVQIPEDVFVALGTEGDPHVAALQRLVALDESSGKEEGARQIYLLSSPEMEELYDTVGEWIGDAGTESNLSLDAIGNSLLHTNRLRPVKLALVLPGGGAKCAYQVGAIGVLEDKLKTLPDIDIGLVVGTSGGAINAVPVAMGVTKSRDGQALLAELWKESQIRDILALHPRTEALGGAFLAVVLSLGVFFCCARHPLVRQIVLFSLGTALLLCALLGVSRLVRTAGGSAWGLMLIESFGTWAGLLLIVAGASDFLLMRHRAAAPSPRWRLKVLGVAALLVLPAMLLNMLWLQPTAFGAEGIERALLSGFKRLVELDSGSFARDDGAPRREQLAAMSEHLLDSGALERDLVLTASCLRSSSGDLPSDLYFYRARSRRPPRGTEERAVCLDDHEGILLDVVLGSGSIYPAFPARRIDDFPRKGMHVDLVDGGFAHNSPIEAAVAWGATHVFIIEPSEPVTRAPGGLLNNVMQGFDHLYYQAQLIDRRSKSQVVVYTLAPIERQIGLLDFAEDPIKRAIDRGRADAAGGTKGSSDLAMFKREFGRPTFVDVTQPPP